MKRVMAFGIILVVLIIILIVYLNIFRQVDKDRLVLSGVVEAEEHDIAFRISGLITDIFYNEGDLIDSGSTVAELDKSELEALFDQTNKSYEAAIAAITSLRISLETINRNLDKIETLKQSGAATQSQYDDLFDQKRQVRAQLEHAIKAKDAVKAAVDMARVRLDYAVLTSYSKGTVISRMNQPGEVVMPGAPVIIISDLDDLTIKVYLPEIYLGKIKLGQNVKIQIDSHPDKFFPGVIKHISDKAEFTPKNIQTKEERVKQVFAVEIASDSHGGILKPGLPCDVVISIQQE